MDRVILVAVIYLGFEYAVSHSLDAWNSRGYPYPPRPTPPSPCNTNWINRTSNNCSVEITCHSNSGIRYMEMSFDTDSWRWKCYESYDYYENEEVTDNTVKYINLRLVGSDLLELKFNNNSDFLNRIKQILLKDNPVDVPEDLYKITALEDIEINKYEIKALDLTRFIEFKELKKLNVSQNLIKDIVTNINTSLTSKLEILDLSHNIIENVQNSWKLNKFVSLIFLNLSHNAIKNIDELSFEGLTQLRSLYLSYNRILQVGSFLTKLNNIEELTLDHNEITAIEKKNFAGLYKIEKLNLSSNAVQFIQVLTFNSLTDLKELDLSYNKLIIIEKQLLRNNNKLCSLSLRNNNITTLESGAFEGKNITQFDIENNIVSGAIDKSFQAINQQNLDLSKMRIRRIGSKTFNSAVRNLNLSHNIINSIFPSAFIEAKHLERLDLSYNQFLEINFVLSSSKALSSLDLQHNRIQKIKQSALKGLESLENLDLSNNGLTRIENKSFEDMKNLEALRLNNNMPLKNFEIGTFDGLDLLMYLDFSQTSITELQNDLFSDLKQLGTLNASHCQIKEIQYNAFKNFDSIENIDLSYNLLTKFSINNKGIVGVKVLFLAFNKIKIISDDTFHGLPRLQSLDLSSNNIMQISDNAFDSLKQLQILNLASNTDADINTKTLNKLSLEKLILRNITKAFNFEHTINTNVTHLDLSYCQIENLDNIFVYKLDVKELVLKSNEITQLDKNSFQNSTSFEYLDVSSNSISRIQPGTFLKLMNLKTLNLHDNNISKLELGAFEGLTSLQTLNLSSNEINSFNRQNVRNLPALKNISLDNNKIEVITVDTFVDTSVSKITIGGNAISCSDLSQLIVKRYYYPRPIKITAEILDFHSENIDGITCSNKPGNRPKSVISPETNATYLLANAIDKLQETISNKIILHNSSDGNSSLTVNMNDTLQESMNNVLKKVVEDVNSTNDSHLQNEHSDVKSLVFITVACLVIIVIMFLTVFVPKVKHLVLYKFKRHQRGIPLMSNGAEID